MAQEKLRVLLAEHDPAFGRYVSEMLGQARNFAAEVAAAADLQAGLALLSMGTFDVVLMDIGLPDGAGLGNLAVVRALAPAIPVIVAGESEEEALAIEAVHAGAYDYLVKGQLTPAWLERSVRYAVERERMDSALLDAEEKYHQVFDHLVEGIFRTSPDGRYLMANLALARIYGYGSPEEMMAGLTDIGRKLYVQPGRRDEFVRLMQEHAVITGFESQVYRKDGTVIWISENCRTVRGPDERVLYYEGTVEDITQRRKAQEQLRVSEALYHSLVETLPQNIFRKDLQHRFTFANQQFCRALGRPLEEIVGKTDFDFFPAPLAEKYQQDDLKVLQTGEPYETIEEHQPPGGSTIYVQVVKTPLRQADGTLIGLQAIFWDITQQRRAEENIRRANAELTRSRRELRVKNEQMEDDLRMAREIQLTILPQQYPVFSRANGEGGSAFQFAQRYLPTGSVGGDFFTVSALSETQVGVFVCDVAGHGVRSALVTTMIRALVEELKPVAAQPGEFLTKLNRELCAILQHAGSPLLTTAFYLVADSRTGAMLYANAGHPRPLHARRRAGEALELMNLGKRGQPVLGLLENATYTNSETALEPGDIVLLFTDGLVELENREGELYEQRLLKAAVQKRLHLNAQQLLDEVLEEALRFSGDSVFPDDVCLVSLEYAG